MFDEASDVTMTSLLNVFVNSLRPDGHVDSVTLTLRELEQADSDYLYNTLRQILDQYNVNLGRIIGICSDGCSVMLGKWKGVCTDGTSRANNERD